MKPTRPAIGHDGGSARPLLAVCRNGAYEPDDFATGGAGAGGATTLTGCGAGLTGCGVGVTTVAVAVDDGVDVGVMGAGSGTGVADAEAGDVGTLGARSIAATLCASV